LKKRITRKILLVTLAGTILFSCIMSGCTKNKASRINVDTSVSYLMSSELALEQVPFIDSLSNNEVIATPEEESFALHDAICIPEGYLYLWETGGNGYVSILDESHEFLSGFQLISDINGIPSRILQNADGSYLILYSHDDLDAWNLTYSACYFNIRGEQIGDDISLKELDDLSVLSWDIDSHGNIYILTNTKMIAFDPSMRLLFDTTAADSREFLSFAFDNKDQLYAVSLSNSGQIILSLFSSKNGIEENAQVINGMTSPYSMNLIGRSRGFTEGIALEIDESLYYYEKDENSITKCIDLPKNGVYINNSLPILASGKDGFILLGSMKSFDERDNTGETDGILNISVTKSNIEKKILTIGILTSDKSELLDSAVYLFNQSNIEYSVVVQNYADYSSVNTSEEYRAKYEEGRKLLVSEILSGNSPDIIVLSEGDTSYFEESGVLADLNVLIDNDELFDSSQFLPNIWSSGNINEKRYWITPFFHINGILGLEDVMGDRTGWTFDEFSSIVSDQVSVKHLFLYDTPEAMLSIFYPSIHSDFVDLNEKKVNFNNQDFIDLLTFFYQYNCPSSESTESINTQISKKELLFLNTDISDIEGYISYTHIFDGKAELSGIPGKESNPPYVSAKEFYSVSEQSQNKAAAWEFLKFLLSDNIQSKSKNMSYGQYEIPILVSAYEKMIEKGVENYNDGNSLQVISQSQLDLNQIEESEPKSYTSVEMESICSNYRELVSSAKGYMNIENEVLNIIIEESASYFRDAKSVQEVAELIQNRAQTYISEKD